LIKITLAVIGIATVLTLAATIMAATTIGPISIQQALAIGDTGGVHSATHFAPGQLAIRSGLSSNTFAPGQEAKRGLCDYPPDPCAAGIEKQTTTGTAP
jgi:hypothetical protein